MGIQVTQRVRLERRPAVVITRVGLGTAPLGNLFEPVEEPSALATLRAAVAHGIRLLDTAPLYGHGLAEQRVGAVLAELGEHCPADLALCTKVGRLLRPAGRTCPPDNDDVYAVEGPERPVFDFSREGVRASLVESLRRLGREEVDIALIHDPDDHLEEAIREAYPALAELRSEGRVGAVGAGMNNVASLLRIVESTEVDVILLAGRYTLLDTSAASELLPRCLERNVGVMIGGVFNSGVLADPGPKSRFDYRPAGKDVLRRVGRFETVCKRFNVPLKAAALQFPFAHPAVTTVLLGARSVMELQENLSLLRMNLPPGLWGAMQDEQLLDRRVPVPDTDGARG